MPHALQAGLRSPSEDSFTANFRAVAMHGERPNKQQFRLLRERICVRLEMDLPSDDPLVLSVSGGFPNCAAGVSRKSRSSPPNIRHIPDAVNTHVSNSPNS